MHASLGGQVARLAPPPLLHRGAEERVRQRSRAAGHRDDGVGGADASRGSGLQGLRERVDGLGGNLRVISPPGGPTTISVELPCAS